MIPNNPYNPASGFSPHSLGPVPGMAPSAPPQMTAADMAYFNRLVENSIARNPMIEQMVAQAASRGLTREESLRFTHNTYGGQLGMGITQAANHVGMIGNGSVVNATYSYGEAIKQSVGRSYFANGVHTMQPQQYGRATMEAQMAMQLQNQMTEQFGDFGMGTVGGLNQEQYAEVVSAIARKKGLGGIVKSVQNASVDQVYAHAQESETSGYVREILQNAKGNTATEKLEFLKKERGGDQVVMDAVSRISNSDSFYTTDKQATEKLKKLAGAVAAGVGQLQDIYTDLNSSELINKLEELTGMQMNDSDETRKAAQKVRQLKQMAVSAAIPQKQFLDTMLVNNQMAGAVAASSFGLDVRDVQAERALGAAFGQSVTPQVVEDGMLHDDVIRQNVQAAGGSMDSFDADYQSSNRQIMLGRMSQQNPNVFGLDGLANGVMSSDPKFVAQAKAIRDRYVNAQNPEERARADMEALALTRRAGLTPGQVARNMKNVDGDFVQKALNNFAVSEAGDTLAIQLRDAGMTGRDALDTQDMLRKRIGASGLAEIAANGSEAFLEKAKELGILQEGDEERIRKMDELDPAGGNKAFLGRQAGLMAEQGLNADYDVHQKNASRIARRKKALADMRLKASQGKGPAWKKFLNTVFTGEADLGNDPDATRVMLDVMTQDQDMRSVLNKSGIGTGREIDFENLLSGDFDFLAEANNTSVSAMAEEMGYDSITAMQRDLAKPGSRNINKFMERYASDDNGNVFSLDPGAMKNRFFKADLVGKMNDSDLSKRMQQAASLSGLVSDKDNMTKFLQTGDYGDLLPSIGDEDREMIKRAAEAGTGDFSDGEDDLAGKMKALGRFGGIGSGQIKMLARLNETSGGALMEDLEGQLKFAQEALAGTGKSIAEGKGGEQEVESYQAIVNQLTEVLEKIKDPSKVDKEDKETLFPHVVVEYMEVRDRK